MHRPRSSIVATAAAVLLAGLSASAQPSAQPRYMAQMQAELQAMGLAPQCAASNAHTATCTIRATGAPLQPGGSIPPGARRFVVTLRYDDDSDTIYVYADHYAALPADAPNAAQVFRRLLELNWEMLIGRFEWSTTTGEIRLSAVLNTDSNFDRRAFRGVVRSVLRLADRYAEEIARLTGNPVGDTHATARCTHRSHAPVVVAAHP